MEQNKKNSSVLKDYDADDEYSNIEISRSADDTRQQSSDSSSPVTDEVFEQNKAEWTHLEIPLTPSTLSSSILLPTSSISIDSFHYVCNVGCSHCNSLLEKRIPTSRSFTFEPSTSGACLSTIATHGSSPQVPLTRNQSSSGSPSSFGEERPDLPAMRKLFQENIRDEEMAGRMESHIVRVEKYTNYLETVLRERTAAYYKEKKKAKTMLPRTVAAQLIPGKAVEAQSFDKGKRPMTPWLLGEKKRSASDSQTSDARESKGSNQTESTSKSDEIESTAI